SIALWTPFNEGWGQFDSLKTCEYLRSLDDTRLIDHASGWSDQGGEFRSIHKYFVPFKMPKKEKRPVILTEFGGYSLSIENHVYSKKTFGYAKYPDKDKLMNAIKNLWQKEIIPAKEQGLCASIYTQLSDVQDETNGIVTYDRQVVKIDCELMRELNEMLKG
ncbi:MAG: glycoside hydrolase family 2, partial [Clostridia bacterium]|nr:glycoside hydrolase family 2 [Clostridia bacterium]